MGGPETIVHVAEDAAHLEIFRALHEIAIAVGGVMDPLDLARIVVERAMALLGADASSVYTSAPEHETLQRLHSSDTAEPPSVNLPAHFEKKGAAGQAVKLGMLEEPFELNGSSLDVGGSLGVAVYPQHGDDAEVLLQRADVAMYREQPDG